MGAVQVTPSLEHEISAWLEDGLEKQRFCQKLSAACKALKSQPPPAFTFFPLHTGHYQRSAEPTNLKDRKHENSTSPNATGPPSVPQASSATHKPPPPTAISRGRSSRPWSLDGRGQRCTVKGCAEPPSYSFDGRRPAVRCGNHRETKMYRVEHVDKTCGEKG